MIGQLTSRQTSERNCEPHVELIEKQEKVSFEVLLLLLSDRRHQDNDIFFVLNYNRSNSTLKSPK